MLTLGAKTGKRWGKKEGVFPRGHFRNHIYYATQLPHIATEI